MTLFGYEKNEFSANADRTSANDPSNAEVAIFAGGCFWCMEAPFERLDGVIDVVSGYTGGQLENPTYEQVSSGMSGHLEAVNIVYDPSKIAFKTLLDVFWRQIDPTDAGGSFVDRGPQYRSAIFYHNDTQKQAAEKSKKELAESGRYQRPIATEIVKYDTFYPAEEYHQDYHAKNPIRYKFYRHGSGRDQFLKNIWGNDRLGLHAEKQEDDFHPSEALLKYRLTPQQYAVTRQDKTEPPFDNEYWDNKKDGIYVDIISGEALFASTDKFDSGTGWPSFTRPISDQAVTEKTENSLFMKRVEVRSRIADSHLGHVFNDGPATTGLRYCINSAALRFISRGDLEKEGYEAYIELFK